MAIRDPGEPVVPIVRLAPSTRYELRIHEVAPEDIEPNGDRYIIEQVNIGETVEFGQLLVVTQQMNVKPGDPMADPTIENRGVIAGVVIRAGNGHLLGLSDYPLETDESAPRQWACVPMFYAPGDLVLIDHNAKGRALKIVGRECRIVNQIDCLARVNGVKLIRKDGQWVTENTKE